MVVIGIDAAWTTANPSGVALARREGPGWHLVCCEASYGAFLADGQAADHAPNPRLLLARAEVLAGEPVAVVAIDMPVSRLPIIGYRESDRQLSKAYGAKKCSAHTPSAARPGPVSERMTEAFALAGYPLATALPVSRALVEAYPHPALIELSNADCRLEYKLSRRRKYWPRASPAERLRKVVETWSSIVPLLDKAISGTADKLPLPDLGAGGRLLKAYEDMLDAVVCAWVGICVLEGRARSFGDEESAIWVSTVEGARETR